MTIETRAYDAAEHLDSPEEIIAYLDLAFESGDPALIGMALGAVARARGMTAIAAEVGPPPKRSVTHSAPKVARNSPPSSR